MLSSSTQHGTLTDAPGHLHHKYVIRNGVYGACDVALPHCCRHWGVQQWRGVVERQLPEAVVVGDGGDTVGVVTMMVVVEKEDLCCLLIMCL